MSEYQNFTQNELEISFSPKAPIKCLYSGKYGDDSTWSEAALLFTHGAGGTLKADAMENFTEGFVTSSTKPKLLCFQGNMNLASRVKMFKAILEARRAKRDHIIESSPACLGGRSMGARAAVMAANEDTTHLILVSYPLHTGKQTRDQILLEIPASVNVLFISGDHDDMCDIERLEVVRQSMKCKTWRAVAQGADHGMNVKPKSGTQGVGRMTGAIAAAWLNDANEQLTEGTLSWDADSAAVHWSGWYEAKNSSKADDTATPNRASAKPGKTTAKQSKRKIPKYLDEEAGMERNEAPRPKKRRKT